MFMIPLKDVDLNDRLESVIIQQHKLHENNIAEDEIKALLNSSICLLVFDGYDEYKKGTNSAIDAAISSPKGHWFVLITSRPDYMAKEDKKQLGQVQMNGLSDISIEECVNRYFDKDRAPQPEATCEDPPLTSEDLKKNAKKRGMYGLLKIPILLLMLSVLFNQRDFVSERRTEIVSEIILMYINRAKEKGIPIENPDELLRHLGELCYEASQKRTHQLLIEKV